MAAPDVDNVDVLIVGDPGDGHAAVVSEELSSKDVSVARLNLGDVRDHLGHARIGSWVVDFNGTRKTITRATTVWWRRRGQVSTEGLETAEEKQLAADEAPHILTGGLLAARVRWVDEPFVVHRAEHKLYQLAVAATHDVRIPDTVVTNDPAVGRDLHNQHGNVVAKPLSAGRGIAPFTDHPTEEQLEHLSKLPALVQESIDATADIRVVVVGGQAWTWQRPRGLRTLDWRRDDPQGDQFVYAPNETVERHAIRITAALKLTTSVQDWLLTDDGPVFLEVNPQGAWLFLDGARERVAPAFAEHLIAPTETDGEWPAAWRRFLHDFYPKKTAPPNDGVVAPVRPPPVWADAVAGIPDALETARRAHDEAKDAAATAEEKGNRLVQLTLALLTLAIGLAGYHLNLVIEQSWPVWLTALPVAAAFVCLTLSALEASQIDQVGMYYNPDARSLTGTGPHDPRAVLVAHEEMGRELARWTAKRKLSDLMQARAWFTRGLALLIVAGVLAVAVRGATTPVGAAPSTPSPSPATPEFGPG